MRFSKKFISVLSIIFVLLLFPAIFISCEDDNAKRQANLEQEKKDDIQNEATVKAFLWSRKYDWCTIADDAFYSYWIIDTNPSNKKNFCNELALDGIKEMNELCQFSELLYSEMLQTSALQGTKYESNSYFSVSWSYHPNYGLVVKYKKV